MNIELRGKSYRVESNQEQDYAAEDEDDKEISLDRINEEMENRYLSRSELIKNLKFPPSTDRKVIVLPNNEGLGFRNDCYNQRVLGQYISEQEFKNNVYELTRICSLQFSKKLKRETNDPFAIEKKMLLWNIPLLIIAILLFSLRVFNSVTEDYVFEVGVAFYGIGMVFIFYNFIKSQIRKPDMTSFESATKEDLEKKIKQINANYAGKGIKWTLHGKFYWVEVIVQ